MVTTRRTMEERIEFTTPGYPWTEQCAAVRTFEEDREPQWSPWKVKLWSEADYCHQWVFDYLDLAEEEFSTAEEAIKAKVAAIAERHESYRATLAKLDSIDTLVEDEF